MSGGSMDYLCYKVESVHFDCSTIERKTFRRHLDLVAKALHDIEWVDSGDYGEGDENKAILACLNDGALLETTIEEAKQIVIKLDELIQEAK